MKIEFRKVPTTSKELIVKKDLVKISGTFCKITPTLVKIDAILAGITTTNCSRCNAEEKININEKLDFLLSDGIYNNENHQEIVIETNNGIIDFDEIIESELNSIKSDYYLCEECTNNSDEFQIEF